jgi:hypothetical protein
MGLLTIMLWPRRKVLMVWTYPSIFCIPITQPMCDIGYIVKDHLDAIIQVLTNRLTEYNMQILTTKCLNTAVMMMYLLLGADALQTTRHCDVENVRTRHQSNPYPSQSNASGDAAIALRNDISACRKRALFYVMITDGKMPHVNGVDTPDKYFPGHVFVIERLQRGSCNIYQSYINKYDMAGHIDMSGSLSNGSGHMQELMNGLVAMMGKIAWDRECSDFWVKLTNVNAEHAQQFEGHIINNNLLMCYKKVETGNCVSKLKKLVNDELIKLRMIPVHQLDTVYGDARLYKNSPGTPLTNAQMLTSMGKLGRQLN